MFFGHDPMEPADPKPTEGLYDTFEATYLVTWIFDLSNETIDTQLELRFFDHPVDEADLDSVDEALYEWVEDNKNMILSRAESFPRPDDVDVPDNDRHIIDFLVKVDVALNYDLIPGSEPGEDCSYENVEVDNFNIKDSWDFDYYENEQSYNAYYGKDESAIEDR